MVKKTQEPQLREISFEGNMPSTYEKNLRIALAKSKSQTMKKRK